MPDDKGLLSDKERDAAKAWLATHWTKNADCPICGSNSYSVSDKLVYPVTYVGRAVLTEGNVYPQLLVTCTICGYVHHFNAVVMSILSDDLIATSEKKPASSSVDDGKDAAI